MRYFEKKDVVPILNSLKQQYDAILFEIWALNYHMNTQRSETLMMTPSERKMWLDELVKQRNKEAAEIKKSAK